MGFKMIKTKAHSLIGTVQFQFGGAPNQVNLLYLDLRASQRNPFIIKISGATTCEFKVSG
jgi:hypothetical protein